MSVLHCSNVGKVVIRMRIRRVLQNKKQYLSLLLLADEQEDMIYLRKPLQ